MVKLWLPVKYTLTHKPTAKQQLVIIPGAEHMDRSQLQEILQWQDEKFQVEAAEAARMPQRTHSRQEVGKALNEFRKYGLRRSLSLNNKIYY